MRPATPAEEKAVTRALDAMDKGLASRVLGPYRLAISERDGIRFAVLATDLAMRLPKAVLEGADAGGLPIGTLESLRDEPGASGGPEDAPTFHLDLQGAVAVARHTDAQAVRLTEHASRLFLYGRNVLGTSIERYDHDLERGDACIVTNPRGEALGIGTVVGSFKGPREAVRPVVDLGTYLRDQDE